MSENEKTENQTRQERMEQVGELTPERLTLMYYCVDYLLDLLAETGSLNVKSAPSALKDFCLQDLIQNFALNLPCAEERVKAAMTSLACRKKIYEAAYRTGEDERRKDSGINGEALLDSVFSLLLQNSKGSQTAERGMNG